MADSLTPSSRSENMRRIRSKDTKPELLIRSLIYAMGYRYRLHVRDIPGKPDVVFRKRRKAIFVHGCFWHQHPDCRAGRIPNSRREYWVPKLRHNQERDRIHLESLSKMGWNTLVVWECEARNPATLQERLRAFLES